MSGIIIAAVVVSCTGLLLGLFLGVMGKKFYVEVDQKEIDVRAELPGNNCGGCGYAGCDALAKAIAAGEAPANACPVGGAPVASKIGAIMGEEVGESVRMTAFVKCAGDCDKAKENYVYSGAMDCTAMNVVPNGGSKACTYGCMGYGSCVKACPFDAIHIVNGIAVVDKGKCKACGKCVAVCPRHLIEIIPYKSNYTVNCSSNDKGKDVMSACSVGCIGSELDDRITRLQESTGHIVDDVEEILSMHKFLTDTFGKMTGLKKRSLASKYLHFHCPEKFFIYDRTHHEALFYAAGKAVIRPLADFQMAPPNETEAAYRLLWKRFYDTVAIRERENPKLRMTHMPKRYWSTMTEFQDNPYFTPQSSAAADPVPGVPAGKPALGTPPAPGQPAPASAP